MSSEKKTMQKQLIRVFYPTDRARIALRTEADWDANIEPDSVQRNGRVSEFQIETGRLYFRTGSRRQESKDCESRPKSVPRMLA
jgi:hypothetical protein